MGSLCKSGSLVEMNDPSELQHIYRGAALATSVINQIAAVLQQFQSLYRGTAFATSDKLSTLAAMVEFQSLYRGTAFATKYRLVRTMPITWKFQSLYRGTAFATCYKRWYYPNRLRGLNPSIEGQPLQRANSELKFCLEGGFNPSIEGQPLQQSRCRSLDFQWLQQAVFLTYG